MMRVLTLGELEAPLQAQRVGADCEFSGVNTDSRALRPGELFVALRGENFDNQGIVLKQQALGVGRRL